MSAYLIYSPDKSSEKFSPIPGDWGQHVDIADRHLQVLHVSSLGLGTRSFVGPGITWYSRPWCRWSNIAMEKPRKNTKCLSMVHRYVGIPMRHRFLMVFFYAFLLKYQGFCWKWFKRISSGGHGVHGAPWGPWHHGHHGRAWSYDDWVSNICSRSLHQKIFDFVFFNWDMMGTWWCTWWCQCHLAVAWVLFCAETRLFFSDLPRSSRVPAGSLKIIARRWHSSLRLPWMWVRRMLGPWIMSKCWSIFSREQQMDLVVFCTRCLKKKHSPSFTSCFDFFALHSQAHHFDSLEISHKCIEMHLRHPWIWHLGFPPWNLEKHPMDFSILGS